MRTHGLDSFLYDSEVEKCKENAGRILLGSETVERLLAFPSVRGCCDYFRPWWVIFLFPLGLPLRAQGAQNKLCSWGPSQFSWHKWAAAER